MSDKNISNIQKNAYQLTINNPMDYGYTHDEIKKRLIVNFTTLKYFCMADEIGEHGTPHTHIYIFFTSRVRWSKVKKHFPEAHIEFANGLPQSNVDYIKKTGKWEQTAKSETSVKGTYEEWGEFPKRKGKMQDMEELYLLIINGYTNAEIIASNPDYIREIDKLDKVRTMYMQDYYKNKRRLDLNVVYISGATGSGKTRGILDRHGDGEVYRVSDYQHPFDGYNCQQVMCFDEFRSQLRISDMLNYLDIYPIELPARYANKFACFNTVYIVSNWSLEQQYREIQNEDPESWKAFLRRIKQIHVYNDDNTVNKYDSVEKYLQRDIKESGQEDNPFFKREDLNE